MLDCWLALVIYLIHIIGVGVYVCMHVVGVGVVLCHSKKNYVIHMYKSVTI